MSEPDVVEITVNGRTLATTAGLSVAAALLNAGVQSFRTSVAGEPRGPVCGMGICWECRVRIDGRAPVRACMVAVSDGMNVSTVHDG